MKKEIWFDMDGTIANLYAIEGWLNYLIEENTYPYDKAGTMLNFSLLARYLNKLQQLGWYIGIASWASKEASEYFYEKIVISKSNWLNKHLKSVTWNEIKVLPYGTNKFEACGGGILFDDEEKNRNAWKDIAYTPDKIIEILKGLITNPLTCRRPYIYTEILHKYFFIFIKKNT